MTEQRDGFVIYDELMDEVHFIPSTLEGSQRERALAGIIINMGDGLIAVDTRDEEQL